MSLPRRHDDVLGLIGSTPVVRLRRAVVGRGASIWAKLESLNPGGSVKDRIAVHMLRQAEAAGQIRPGHTTIIEATSGNTGIGLALACAVLGYRLVLTMPENLSVERRQLLRAYGAELVLTPADEVMAGAIRRAQELGAALDDVYYPRQFDNPANPEAHCLTTGPELVAAFEDIGLHGVVVGIGTGGTLSGIAPVLRAAFPRIVLWGVEPDRSAVLHGESPGAHGIQGIGAGFVPSVYDAASADEVARVDDEEAIAGARALARAEGLLVGISSGACYVAARRLARKLGPGRSVCFLVASGGERYLSTGLFG
jgi:cysteine synthase A